MKNFPKIPFIIVFLFLIFSLTDPFKYRVQNLDPGPVKTFENNCARCHGPHGSFYGEGFGSKEHDDLRGIVEEMMRGPAFLKPSDAEVQAMTAYHHALSKGEPFICITNYDSTNHIIHGEVALQEKLYIKQKNDNKRELTVDSQGMWETELTANSFLVATIDSSGTKLDPQKVQWSHQK